MKFLSLPDFDTVTSALNFDTPDCHVTGGCDLYTTKAAGTDKKLYKNIDKSLESQHAALLKFGASLSPPQRDSLAASLNLSRSSPFGPLSEVSSRRTFAYLIATLNASHPDYDFSHVLRPADFKRERSLRSVMSSIDSTLNSARPSSSLVDASMPRNSPPGLLSTAPVWGPQMWALIDKEMSLMDCTVFSYQPADDPFEEDQSAIWSLHYFFFNKARKRVCYLYVRAVPVVSHSSPRLRASRLRWTAGAASGGVGDYDYEGIGIGGRRDSLGGSDFSLYGSSATKRRAGGSGLLDAGANKRARFWLGDQMAERIRRGSSGYEDDMDEDDGLEWNRGSDGDLYSFDEDDEIEDVDELEDEDDELSGPNAGDEDDREKDKKTSADKEERRSGDMERRKGHVRAVSEDIAANMEI
ncbi:hypothetical protein VTK73DRAFT_5099 [Phialemonium thermophilum]|uniref:Repressor of RNA polymerase III transcription MAF1 n=1 Tax=Phialemonium thermophilum TaxID=223376 RepID=A0ABR3WPR5_9PEZI